MPNAHVDPARLKGEALNQWYRRTPDEIEAERRARDEQHYREFFNGPQAAAPEPTPSPAPAAATDLDVLWVANGSGGYRAIRPGQRDYFAATDVDGASEYPTYLPDSSAAPEDGDLLEIGNPHNRRLKREHVAKYGPWPRTADGRNYHVAHILATADGGTQTLDNIRPMDPDEHMAEHKRNGDFVRWGARGGQATATARAKQAPKTKQAPQAATPSPSISSGPQIRPSVKPQVGATRPTSVRTAAPGSIPPKPKPAAPPAASPTSPRATTKPAGVKPKLPSTRGGPPGGVLGAMSLLPILTGVLSGRIRTDTPAHFWFDAVGEPAPDDPRPDLYA